MMDVVTLWGVTVPEDAERFRFAGRDSVRSEPEVEGPPVGLAYANPQKPSLAKTGNIRCKAETPYYRSG